ncbi:SAM-dependent methyltransferase [Kitasatospora viridis]|uniref:S-adenosyl methyltransferase n=1 Tax=Kitasatospora viridis TaxID=281105 RepID=A0A561TT89_9ACTN|nr:SAM-dependent methyltransferase [Kitasatospora viridis]TWF90297.1 S-adenosyl methyltransferase [Kitasatospora viridis]
MGGTEEPGSVDLQLHRAHSARMYDYYLGGTTNFAADREAAGQAMAVFPWARTGARENRAFMHRSTEALAALGLDQFLDIGTGIPTSPNLHEVAQRADPRARVVYTDNDPIVLAHAQALLRSTDAGRTAYLQADVADPERILASREVRETLDLGRPVALSLNALLHFVADDAAALAVVEHFKRALPSGSTLAISHGTPEFAPAETERVTQVYAAAGTSVRMRDKAGIARFFDGWELLEPGLVPTQRWRPADGKVEAEDAEVSAYAAVARKP